MRDLRTHLKKIVLAVHVLSLLAGMSITANAMPFGTHYDAEAAVSYAQEHWDDGVGVCDQFVKDCLRAGDVDILTGGVGALKNALVDAKLGEQHSLVISADGVHALASENPHVQPGDVLFFFCEECDSHIHTAIFGGTNNSGYLYSYGHHPGWDQVDWFGNFTHTLENGQQHRKCYQYIVVSMNRENYSHQHNFTSDLYETDHPHKMYAQCSCEHKYYLGWNATVSYCTTCNPPAADIPLVTVSMEDGKARVTWTTVEGALEYQVWRARSENGTYFNLYSAMGTKMLNSSVEMGNTYYYKIIAVLEKDAHGNVLRSATSAVTSFTLEETPAGPATPMVAGTLNTNNKAVISWNTVQNAVKYEVWRSTSENGTYTKLITTTNLQCINSAKPGTYYYKVRAIDTNGNTGAYSNIVCVTVPGQTDVVPVITGKLNTSNKAVISWNTVQNAVKYEVWRSTSENGTYTKLITTTNLQCTNSANPGTYYYKVRAIDTNGNTGAYSNIVCVTVPGQTDVVPVITGKLNTNNKALISWNTVQNAVKYEVWRSTSENGTYTKLITTTNLQCINSAKPGTYYYKVRAIDTNGNTGAYSNIVCVTVPGQTDVVPVITGKLNTSNKAVISWNTVQNAVKYEVWRSTSENGTYTRLITTTNLQCINSAKPGTYYYKVRAIDTNGNAGTYSNIVCVTVS